MFKKRLQELLILKCEGKQTILMQKTGIAQSTISSYFIRGSLPSAEQLIKLAEFFECSIDYLLGRENDFGIIESKNNLTLDENELLTIYRKLDIRKQNKLIGYANALYY